MPLKYGRFSKLLWFCWLLFTLLIDIPLLWFQAEESCKCNGWKNPNPPPTPPRADLQQTVVSLTEPCRSCSHTLGKILAFSWNPRAYTQNSVLLQDEIQDAMLEMVLQSDINVS